MTASDEAKKALEGVTPGPWFTSPDGWRVTDKIVSFDEDGARHGETPNICIFAESEANARFIAWAREGVPALLAEIASKDAEIARLRGEIIEATDENFIWGAMDNVHDDETTLDDYAAAVSRAQRAAIASVKRWW